MTPTDDDASGPYLIRCQERAPVEAIIVPGLRWRRGDLRPLFWCSPPVFAWPSPSATRHGFTVCSGFGIVVPTAIASLATGCLWGVAGAVAWPGSFPTWTRVAADGPDAQHPGSMRWKSAASAAPLVVIGVTLGFTSVGRAKFPMALSGAGRHRSSIACSYLSTVRRAPTKDKYQVPQFYDELRRRAGDEPNTDQGWLIRSAQYRVTINRESASDTLGPSDVLAQYEVVVLKPDALVSLPMTGVRPGLTARREGREFDIPWDSDEDGLAPRFDEPGTYQLNVSLRPPAGAKTRRTLWKWRFRLFRKVRSKCDCRRIRPLSKSPPLAGRRDDAVSRRSQTIGGTGPATRLSIRWSRTHQTRLNADGGDADVWLWLQIQPASVVVPLRLDIKALKSPLSQGVVVVNRSTVATAARCRSLGHGCQCATSCRRSSNRAHRAARPMADHVTIPVSFLLTGSSGIGQLSLPRILPQGVRVETAYWLCQLIQRCNTIFNRQPPDRGRRVPIPLGRRRQRPRNGRFACRKGNPGKLPRVLVKPTARSSNGYCSALLKAAPPGGVPSTNFTRRRADASGSSPVAIPSYSTAQSRN